MLFALFTEDALNISSSQPVQPHPSDNRTLQSFLEVYVDKYVGGYPVECQKSVPYAFLLQTSYNIHDFW